MATAFLAGADSADNKKMSLWRQYAQVLLPSNELMYVD